MTARVLRYNPNGARTALPAADRLLTDDDRAALAKLFGSKYSCVWQPAYDRTGADARLRFIKPTADISVADQPAMFHWYNYCRYQVIHILRSAARRRPPAAALRRLLAWYWRAVAIRNVILVANEGLASTMAGRVPWEGMPYEDKRSIAYLALIRAIDGFNVTYGVQFSTYACRTILCAFWGGRRKTARRHALEPCQLDETRANGICDVAGDHDGRLDVRGMLETNAAELTEKEQRVLHLRFGLQDGRALTLKDVGACMDLTKERVRQIQARAIGKIRARFET